MLQAGAVSIKFLEEVAVQLSRRWLGRGGWGSFLGMHFKEDQ